MHLETPHLRRGHAQHPCQTERILVAPSNVFTSKVATPSQVSPAPTSISSMPAFIVIIPGRQACISMPTCRLVSMARSWQGIGLRGPRPFKVASAGRWERGGVMGGVRGTLGPSVRGRGQAVGPSGRL